MHLRFLIAVLITMQLAGCGQDDRVQTAGGGPPAEPADVSSKDFGDYVVHFNALTTDQLQPQVARTYGIVRSPNRAMLNVSIIRKVEAAVGVSVPGSVSVSAVNLTGQLKNLAVRQIQEADAIYYIGDIPVANGETLVFNIDVTPINETSRFSVRFSRTFFAE